MGWISVVRTYDFLLLLILFFLVFNYCCGTAFVFLRSSKLSANCSCFHDGQILNDLIQNESEPKKKLYDLKIQLIEEMGWNHVSTYEKQWMQVRFPPSLPPFWLWTHFYNGSIILGSVVVILIAGCVSSLFRWHLLTLQFSLK